MRRGEIAALRWRRVDFATGQIAIVESMERGMQPTFITHEWVRQIRNTTLPRLRFHDLRHAHATHLLSSGVHPKVASERLGHSKVGITLDVFACHAGNAGGCSRPR